MTRLISSTPSRCDRTNKRYIRVKINSIISFESTINSNQINFGNFEYSIGDLIEIFFADYDIDNNIIISHNLFWIADSIEDQIIIPE